MQKAGTAIAGAFALGAVVDGLSRFRDATRQAIDAVGGLGEAASAAGVTTATLQEYRYIATQVGLSNQEMDKGLAQLTRRLGEAAQGSKEPTEALKRLGLTLDDVKGKEAGDVIPLLAEGMAKIPDAANRAAIATDLFGKAGQKLMPLLEGGRASVDGLREAAHKLGVVMSEEAIKRADEAADMIAAQERVVEAQRNVALSQPENVKAMMAYTKAMTDLEIALYRGVGGLEASNQAYNKWALSFNANLRSSINGAAAFAVAIPAKLSEAAAAAIAAVANMVNGIRGWIGGKLNAVWNGVTARIDAVAAKFKWLDDVVVRNSYVPDMVDSIGEHMARLDRLMVGKAAEATTKTADKFRDLARDIRGLLDEAFPDDARIREFRDKLALLGEGVSAGLIGKDRASDTANRLLRNLSGAGRGDVEVVTEQGALNVTKGLDDVLDSLDTLKKRAGATSVAIAKNFQDMATATMSALTRLSGAIKGGGFLGILEAVIGLGLQLGSIGALGKKIQTNINTPKIPGYASGTNSAARGWAWTGERGPELVKFKGGERVLSNRESMGMRGGGGTLDIRPSPLFEVYLDGKLVQAAPAMIQGGAQAGVAMMSYRQSRRVG